MIMATQGIRQSSVSEKLINRWELVSEKLAALGEAIPEKQFHYKPVEDVRSCDEVLRHVAFWNRYVADSARGNKPDDQGNELSKKQFSTKKQIVDALRQSAADAATALKDSGSGLSAEKVEMLVTFIEHSCEHYGQLVIYARLNGIVPPASRG
jgi:uncharacterized damage-inducible protein DinB